MSLTALELDKYVVDLTLKSLFHNSDKSELGFESDILAKAKVKLSKKEVARLWNVLATSVWVAPSVGFGRAGKLELTQAGYQLMSQFGGYHEYLASVENSQKPQTIILPISVTDDSGPGEEQEPAPAAAKKK